MNSNTPEITAPPKKNIQALLLSKNTANSFASSKAKTPYSMNHQTNDFFFMFLCILLVKNISLMIAYYKKNVTKCSKPSFETRIYAEAQENSYC